MKNVPQRPDALLARIREQIEALTPAQVQEELERMRAKTYFGPTYNVPKVDALLDLLLHSGWIDIPKKIKELAEAAESSRSIKRTARMRLKEVEKQYGIQFLSVGSNLADLVDGPEPSPFRKTADPGPKEEDMNVIVVLQTLDQEKLDRFDTPELILTSIEAKNLLAGYKEHRFPVPDWLVEKIDSLESHIKTKRRDAIKAALLAQDRVIAANQSRESKLADAKAEREKLLAQLEAESK